MDVLANASTERSSLFGETAWGEDFESSWGDLSMRRRPQKRTLDIERLDPKISPASLLEAISFVDGGADDIAYAAPISVEVAALSAPESLHWTCCPTSQEVLQFIQTNTIECSLNADESEADDYDFHRLQDDEYVAAADHAIELFSGAMMQAALGADQLDFS